MMAELRIFGRELTVGILGGHALPPIEIVPREGFYDYDNKYIAGRTEEICPAPIGEESTAKAAAITRSAFDLLGLRGYARADYIMDGEGRMWLLEINTLPGMTATSLLPQEAAAAVICSNKQKPADTRKACKNSCIGCKKCEKNCATGAIKVENNLAIIDYSLCNKCGVCAENCPVGCILVSDFNGIHKAKA